MNSRRFFAYISPNLLPWSRRFPNIFWLNFTEFVASRISLATKLAMGYIGKLIRALIYDPLPPDVREELEAKDPYLPERKGRRRRHQQLLTQDVEHPHLEKQITSVRTLLRISDDWAEFTNHFSRAFPPSTGLFRLPASPIDAER